MISQLIFVAVTAVLKDLLENGLVESTAIMSILGDVKVSSEPPDRISVGTDEQIKLNLFLYQMTQNRNAEWIAQKRRGDRNQSVKNPGSENLTLGLNLHYVLTAYGSKDFQTELLLGYAMQLLRDTPITSDTIHTTLKHIASTTDGFLAKTLTASSITDISERIGEIKIYPTFLNTEEMSKLWSLLHGSYRPSIVYKVSTVLID